MAVAGRQHLSDAVPSGLTTATLAAALRADIAGGRLEPGAALRQDELAERFHTSRIPVREALRTLEAEGLVTYAPNRGAVVTVVSAQEVQEMLEVRIALECHALKMAVPMAAECDLDTLRHILTAYDAGPDAATWSSMNWQFHWALYTPCDCKRLLEAIERNFNRFSTATRRQISALAGKDRPQREHWTLLELIGERKGNQAVALLEHHIRDTQRSIRAKMR